MAAASTPIVAPSTSAESERSTAHCRPAPVTASDWTVVSGRVSE